MARFCENCGAPLNDGVRFCGECGTPVPEAAAASPVSAPETSYSVPEAPAAAVAAPPKPAQPKKPLPKWVVPVIAAVVVIAGGLFATWKILGNLHAPEKTVDSFLEALDNGDAEALIACAVCADGETELTADNTAPLFRLCEKDSSFRETVEKLLDDELERIEDEEDPKDDQLFTIVGEKGFLYTTYTVSIGTGSVEISSNLTGTAEIEGGASVKLTPEDDGYNWAAGWTDKFGPDCDLAQWSTGTARDLLPGLYNVSGSVTTSFGDTFTASAEVRVTGGTAYAELNYECETLEIYNDNGLDIEIVLGGEVYGVLESYQSYAIAPIRPGTRVEVRADVGADEPVSLSSTVEEAGGYFNVVFSLCEVEIRNDYHAPITVTRDGQTILEVPAGDTAAVANLPEGVELTMSLYAGVTEDVTAVCEDTHSYLRPEFYLADAQPRNIEAVVQAYIQTCIDAFNDGDTIALRAMDPETGFSRECLETLESVQSQGSEEEGLTVTAQITVTEMPAYQDARISVWTGDDGVLGVSVDASFPYDYVATAVYQDGEPVEEAGSNVMSYTFDLRYAAGAWDIVAAD